MVLLPLYDAVEVGLKTLQHCCNDRKALVVITDGMDNSSNTTLQSVLSLAQSMKVPIYSIGIGNSNYEGSGTRPLLHNTSDKVDTKTLNMLANGTGATTYLIPEIGDGKAVTADAKAIASDINSRYTLGYVSDDATQAGLRLELRNRSDLTLHVEGAPVAVVNTAPSPPAR